MYPAAVKGRLAAGSGSLLFGGLLLPAPIVGYPNGFRQQPFNQGLPIIVASA
jgi:hypothetical protein